MPPPPFWSGSAAPCRRRLRARARILGMADTGSGPHAGAHRHGGRGPAGTGTRAGLQPADVDLFEINEGFAAMALHFIEEMGGRAARQRQRRRHRHRHAMGCTGAALVSVLLDELDRARRAHRLHRDLRIAAGRDGDERGQRDGGGAVSICPWPA